MHTHIGRDDKVAKFWLSPVRQAYNYGFAANELSRIERLVRQHEARLVRAWDDYFKSRDRGGDS
jgi:uncharacterized protein DUF4160